MPKHKQTRRRHRSAARRPRVDGPLKSAKGAVRPDFHFPDSSSRSGRATIASGRVIKLDTAAAEKMAGGGARFFTRKHRKHLPFCPGTRVRGIIDERRRRSRMTSFATTASTSRSLLPIHSKVPGCCPTRFARRTRGQVQRRSESRATTSLTSWRPRLLRPSACKANAGRPRALSQRAGQADQTYVTRTRHTTPSSCRRRRRSGLARC